MTDYDAIEGKLVNWKRNDREEWSFPLRLIVEKRIAALGGEGTFFEEAALKEAVETPRELIAWAQKNVPWEEFYKNARLAYTAPAEPEIAEGFKTADIADIWVVYPQREKVSYAYAAILKEGYELYTKEHCSLEEAKKELEANGGHEEELSHRLVPVNTAEVATETIVRNGFDLSRILDDVGDAYFELAGDEYGDPWPSAYPQEFGGKPEDSEALKKMRMRQSVAYRELEERIIALITQYLETVDPVRATSIEEI